MAASHARISWRKILIRHRNVFYEAWHMAFPLHDLVTGRLRRDSLDFDELVERLAKGKARDLHDERSSRCPTPQTTVEATLHCVRERGIAALKEPANLERLARCDAAAKAQIDKRIEKLTAATEKAHA